MQVLPILPQAERPPASQTKTGDADFGASMRSAEARPRGVRRDEAPSREAGGKDTESARTAPQQQNADRTPSRGARAQNADHAKRPAANRNDSTDTSSAGRAAAEVGKDAGIPEESTGEQTRRAALLAAPAAPEADLATKVAALWGDDPAGADPDAADAAAAVVPPPPIQTPADPADAEAAAMDPAAIELVDVDPASAASVASETALVFGPAQGPIEEPVEKPVSGDADTENDPAHAATAEQDDGNAAPDAPVPVQAEAAPPAAGQPDADESLADEAIPAVAAGDAEASAESDPAKAPPGMERAADRSSGAPFQSRMPDTAKPAETALNRAPPFAIAMQDGPNAGPAESDGEDAPAPAIADASTEPTDIDAGETTKAAKGNHDKPASTAANTLSHPAADRPATPAHGGQVHPITAEGAFQPTTDPRGVTPATGNDPLNLGAPSVTSHAAAKSYGAEAMQPAPQQIAVNIARAAQEGADRLTVHLKPASLGRVSIELEVGHDHRVIAVIAADRPDTFELLQRDSKVLERALNNAGLTTDSGSLSFDLRGQNDNRNAYEADSGGRTASFHMPEDVPVEAAARAQSYGGDGRLDIRI